MRKNIAEEDENRDGKPRVEKKERSESLVHFLAIKRPYPRQMYKVLSRRGENFVCSERSEEERGKEKERKKGK